MLQNLARKHIQEAHLRILGAVSPTPLIKAATHLGQAYSISDQIQTQIYLKTEHKQHAKAFKYRGALNKLMQLSDAELQAGFVTYSTGNHAIALAAASKLVARQRGFPVPIQVCISTEAMKDKIDLLRQSGASLRIIPSGGLDQCRKEAVEIADECNIRVIPSCDDFDIIAGNASVAVEISEQAIKVCGQPLDAIIVPVGGGSLLAGVATWFHGSTTQIWAAEPMFGGPSLNQSLSCGRLLRCDGSQTIADGQRSSIGEKTWDILQHQASFAGCISVTDNSTLEAMKIYAECYEDLIEPSSAVALAAALSRPTIGGFLQREAREGHVLRLGVILTGGNISLGRFEQLFEPSEKK